MEQQKKDYQSQFANNLALSYHVNNGVPNQLKQTLNPFQRFDH